MISKHLPHLKCLWSELLFLHLLQGLHIWNLRITWYPHVLMWTSWQLDYLLDLDFLKGWVYDLLLCIAPNPITVPSRHQTLKCRFVKVTNLYFKKYLSALKRERRRNYFWSIIINTTWLNQKKFFYMLEEAGVRVTGNLNSPEFYIQFFSKFSSF